MIVELLGPPGAGKSALVPVLVRALSQHIGGIAEFSDAAVDRLLRRTPPARVVIPMLGANHLRWLRLLLVDLPYGASFMASHPRLTLSALSAALRSPVGWGHRRTLFARWAGVAARQQFLRGRMGGGIAIFDEGLYHRSVNLFAWRALDQAADGRATAAERTQLRRYLRLAPAPDLAVFVDAPDDVTAQRLARRGLPLRLRRHGVRDATLFLNAAARIARAVPIEVAGRCRWIRIENATSLAVAEEALSRQIGELGRPRAPAVGEVYASNE